MGRSASLLAPVVAAALLAVAADAGAQEAPHLASSDVPAQGARVGDFVPRGWKIAARVAGDLNRDARPDTVLHLVTADTPDDRMGTDAAPEGHALVIVLAGERGRLRRGGVAPRLLVPLVPQYDVGLTIRSGVLIVTQDFGMTDVVNLLHRFRHDPATGRFVLIGKDTFSYTRPLSRDDTFRTSENYLTGVRLATTGHVRDGVVARETTKRERIPRSKTYFEDVDEDPDR